MRLFFDTSALVKFFHEEDGRDKALEHWIPRISARSLSFQEMIG